LLSCCAADEPLERLSRVTPATARLAALVEAIAHEDLALEGAIRRWALRDPAVAAHVAAVDARRNELVHNIYAELHPDAPALAADLARLAQAFYLGAALSDPPIVGDEYRRMAALLMKVHQ
jgi:hypothetical protein